MRNLIIVNDYGIVNGGAGQVAIDNAILFSKIEDYKVFFVYGCGNLCDELKNANITCIKFDSFDTGSLKFSASGLLCDIYSLKNKKRFMETFRNFNPDFTIVHFHGFIKSLSASLIDAAFKLKFKIILTLHDYFSVCPNGAIFNYKQNVVCKYCGKPSCFFVNCDKRNYKEKLFRWFRWKIQKQSYRKIDRFVSISELNEKIFKTFFTFGKKQQQIIYINNPVKTFNNDLPVLNHHKKYYAFVGRISREKNCYLFCKALSSLGLPGYVIGEGEEKSELQKMFPSIIFTGWKSKSELRILMHDIKCLVFPSLWYEGSPLVVAEFLLSGIPVITSDINSSVELVKDNRFIFKSDNVEDLENKISMFEKDKDFDFNKTFDSKFLTTKFSSSTYVEKMEKYIYGK